MPRILSKRENMPKMLSKRLSRGECSQDLNNNRGLNMPTKGKNMLREIILHRIMVQALNLSPAREFTEGAHDLGDLRKCSHDCQGIPPRKTTTC